jgi:acetyl esterase/lipase
MRTVLALLATSAAIVLGALATVQAAPEPVPAASRQPPVVNDSEVFLLWPGRAPGATDDSAAQTPTLTVIRPQPGWGNGTAVVIAPGGGYLGLARALEGTQPAAWFSSRGVTAFVLTYRVGATARLPIPLQDGARAVRWVRAHAAEFRIDPARIGMMGFSAGGHLAATTAVDATTGQADSADPIEQASSRPDFLILAYPCLAVGARQLQRPRLHRLFSAGACVCQHPADLHLPHDE